MTVARVGQPGIEATSQLADQTQVAREARTRMVVATRELENALAAASWHREDLWHQHVHDTLVVLQTSLSDTCNSANSEESLMSEVVTESPRLESKVRRIRAEYADLENHVESLQACFSKPAENTEDDVADIRQRLGWLITALKHVQSKETELLYEAFQVDIGHCD
ncbi:hypothetical protein [Bythopirellula polymerisocia]|uniref:Hemerythrin-like domain-containing protein n=1 Tax=Bythopirellula polymerisocia TaxID=2528003 RepID=A0A5C6CUZ4_9BACT|nr:hypothetical protein [Bythopirellula polymerisocia]TWU27635.1 hypothetical protein Pla144_24120 [Bythopirellula polymerisocia]